MIHKRPKSAHARLKSDPQASQERPRDQKDDARKSCSACNVGSPSYGPRLASSGFSGAYSPLFIRNGPDGAQFGNGFSWGQAFKSPSIENNEMHPQVTHSEIASKYDKHRNAASPHPGSKIQNSLPCTHIPKWPPMGGGGPISKFSLPKGHVQNSSEGNGSRF